MEVAVTLHTDGNGLWSTVAKAVGIVELHLAWVTEERDFGDLHVYFDESWDCEQHGLIYTDKQFKRELNEFLVSQGLCAVSYSEQGMQGDDFVSCDVGKDFIDAWASKFGQATVDSLVC
jgi:hypothetical protein